MTSGMTDAYVGVCGQVSWRGVTVPPEVVTELRGGPLQERVLDLLTQQDLIAELEAMATTEMSAEWVKDLVLNSPAPEPWAVGEGLAEALLQRDHAAIWPWNTTRDKRTPKASLPGADLVGFVKESDRIFVLFGEVKTSSDDSAPPNVVYGKSGLIHQLEKLVGSIDDQWTLLQWLHARCIDSEQVAMYKQAVQRFVASRGKDIRLFGCLMRDTSPNQLDLKARAESLSATIQVPTNVQLLAWYFPESAELWPNWVEVTDNA